MSAPSRPQPAATARDELLVLDLHEVRSDEDVASAYCEALQRMKDLAESSLLAEQARLEECKRQIVVLQQDRDVHQRAVDRWLAVCERCAANTESLEIRAWQQRARPWCEEAASLVAFPDMECIQEVLKQAQEGLQEYAALNRTHAQELKTAITQQADLVSELKTKLSQALSDSVKSRARANDRRAQVPGVVFRAAAIAALVGATAGGCYGCLDKHGSMMNGGGTGAFWGGALIALLVWAFQTFEVQDAADCAQRQASEEEGYKQSLFHAERGLKALQEQQSRLLPDDTMTKRR